VLGTGLLIDDGQLVLQTGADLSDLVRELQPLCDLGLVCDITLRDATEASAVLIGVSSTALVLDHWDDERRRPAGDPYTLPLAAIDRLVVS
jgi:hypothetical protein